MHTLLCNWKIFFATEQYKYSVEYDVSHDLHKVYIVYIIPKYRVKIRRARIGVYGTEYFSHFNILTAMPSSGLKMQ